MAGIESTEIVVAKKKKTGKYVSRKSKKVVQKENVSYLYANVTSIDKTQNVEIITDCDWYLEGCPNWVSVSPMNGNGNTSVKIEIENNEDGIGDIAFSNINDKLLIIKAKHYGLNHYVFNLNVPEGAMIEWRGNGYAKDEKYFVDTIEDECSIGYSVSKEGYNSQEGILTVTSESPNIEKDIRLYRITNLFTFKVNNSDDDAIIVWDNGIRHNMISVITVESSATVTFMVTKDGYGCTEGTMTADINIPNVESDVKIEQGVQNFYYGLYTEPHDCKVVWSNGKNGKNTRITSNNNVQTIRYTASTEGYYDEVGTITADANNISVFGHVNLKKK